MSNLQESNIMQGIVEAFKAASPEEQRTMILAISGIAAFGMLLNYLKSLIK
jgi:chromosome segregation ATPase